MDPLIQLQRVLAKPTSNQAVAAFRRGLSAGIQKLAAAGVQPENAKAIVANFLDRVAAAKPTS